MNASIERSIQYLANLKICNPYSYHCHLYRDCFSFCLIAESGRTLYNTFRWNDCLHRRNGHQMWHIHCSVSLCCMYAIMFPIVGLLCCRLPMLVDEYDDDGDNSGDAMVIYFQLIRANRTASLLNPTSHLNLYPKLLSPNDLLCHLKYYPLKMQLTFYQNLCTSVKIKWINRKDVCAENFSWIQFTNLNKHIKSLSSQNLFHF